MIDKEVASIVSNNHLFWSLDLRSSLDYIYQKTKSGAGYTKVTPNPDGTVTFSNFSKNIPNAQVFVEKATDIRAYIRYNF